MQGNTDGGSFGIRTGSYFPIAFPIGMPPTYDIPPAIAPIAIACPTLPFSVWSYNSSESPTVTAKPCKVPATEYNVIKGYYQQVLKSAEDLIVLRKD